MERFLLVDARGLEPPEPMERVLEALCRAQPGQRVVMLLEREPFPLYRILKQNGYDHAVTCGEDGVYRIEIWDRAG